MERAIAVVNDVTDLSELLDGARVDRARLVPEGGRLRLELELTRACRELQTVVRRGLLKRSTTPWAKSRVVLDRVSEAMVQRLVEMPPEPIPLLTCEAVAGGYQLTVTTSDGLRVDVTLAALSGRFMDTAAPVEFP